MVKLCETPFADNLCRSQLAGALALLDQIELTHGDVLDGWPQGSSRK
jgi:hypothetical protein